MSIQRIQPSKRFSEVVIHNNTAYFCRPSTGKNGQAKCLRATKEVLSLIDKLLAEIGSEKSKISYHANLPCGYGRLCSTQPSMG